MNSPADPRGNRLDRLEELERALVLAALGGVLLARQAIDTDEDPVRGLIYVLLAGIDDQTFLE